MIREGLLLICLATAMDGTAAVWKQEMGIGGGMANWLDTDGNKLYAAASDGLYSSPLAKDEWRRIALPGIPLNVIVKTDSGFVAYAAIPNKPTYTLHISRDQGATWKATTLTGSLRGIIARGKGMLAIRSVPGGRDTLLASPDGGLTWNPQDSIRGGQLECGWLGGVVSCADGGIIITAKGKPGDGWDTLKVNPTFNKTAFGSDFLYGVLLGGGLVKYSATGLVWSRPHSDFGSPRSLSFWHASDSLLVLKTDSAVIVGRGAAPTAWETYKVIDPLDVVVNRMIWAGGRGFPTTKYNGSFAMGLAAGEARYTPFESGLLAGYNPTFRVAGKRLYAATMAGIWSRPADAETWTLNVRLPDAPVYFWAEAGAFIVIKRGKFQISADEGATFQPLGVPGASRIIGRIGNLYLAAADTLVNDPKALGGKAPIGEIWQAASPAGPWTRRGSCGKSGMTLMAAAGSDLFAVSSGQLLRSRDSGATCPDTMLVGRTIKSLEADGGKIYAGTDSGRVFATADGGAKWEEIVRSPATTGSIDYLAAADGKLFLAARPKDTLPYVQAISGGTGMWAGMESASLPGQVVSLAWFQGRLYAGTSFSGALSYPSDILAVRQSARNGRARPSIRRLRMRGEGGSASAPDGFRRLDGKVPAGSAPAGQWEYRSP